MIKGRNNLTENFALPRANVLFDTGFCGRGFCSSGFCSNSFYWFMHGVRRTLVAIAVLVFALMFPTDPISHVNGHDDALTPFGRVLAFVSPSASAQSNPRPILPRKDGPRPAGPGYEVPCGPCHSVSVYDPHMVPTNKDNNHKTLQQAINHTKPGGTVIVHRDRNRPWLEPFIVRTPNITIKAADAEFGGTVVIRQDNMSCVSVEPAGGRRFSAVTTTIEGFTFIANDGALKPCVVVRKGTLKLVNSRIDLGESNTTGIDVAATAALEFSGTNYDEHGIVAGVMESAQPGNPRNGVGVRADGSKSIMLTGIRLQGLATGLQTRAEVNAMTGVRFFNNGVGISIEDAAVVSAYAPGLLINGGAFIDNGDGILLSAGGFGARQRASSSIKPVAGAGLKPPTPSATRSQFSRPFRGRVLVTAEATDKVVFERNLRGISFSGAYPSTGFRVERTQFLGQRAHALKLNLPLRTRAELSGVDFYENVTPIVFDGVFDGELMIGEGSTLFGLPIHQGISLEEGRGRITAIFDNVLGLRPVFRIGEYFDGLLNLTVKPGVNRFMVYFSEETSLCRASLRSKDDRLAFQDELASLSVFMNAQPIHSLFGEGGKLPQTKGQMRLAQDILCGRVVPEDVARR